MRLRPQPRRSARPRRRRAHESPKKMDAGGSATAPGPAKRRPGARASRDYYRQTESNTVPTREDPTEPVRTMFPDTRQLHTGRRTYPPKPVKKPDQDQHPLDHRADPQKLVGSCCKKTSRITRCAVASSIPRRGSRRHLLTDHVLFVCQRLKRQPLNLIKVTANCNRESAPGGTPWDANPESVAINLFISMGYMLLHCNKPRL